MVIDAPSAKTGILSDPTTGQLVSPIVAAALCIEPRGLLTEPQAAKVNAFKTMSAEFATMRGLAMRFRGILRGTDTEKLDVWLHDADRTGLYGIRRFVRSLRQDLAAVRNAITETWSNGQTEGQINRLKTLKRAMYGSAGVELLRARMLPIRPTELRAEGSSSICVVPASSCDGEAIDRCRRSGKFIMCRNRPRLRRPADQILSAQSSAWPSWEGTTSTQIEEDPRRLRRSHLATTSQPPREPTCCGRFPRAPTCCSLPGTQA
jgi:Transposase